MLALFGNAACCDARGPRVSTELGMHGDQRLVLKSWESSGHLGLSLPRSLFPVDVLGKGA